MIKCKKCKQKFCSTVAYGIHTWMQMKEGRKTICPSPKQLRKQGMSLLYGQWLVLAEKEGKE